MRFLDAMPNAECVTGNLVPVVVPHVVDRCLSQPVRDAFVRSFTRSLDEYLGSGAYHGRLSGLRKWLATRDGLRSLAQAAGGRRRCELVVYKEPFLSFAPRYVLDALPEGAIVYIVRDGRDVANSLVRTYNVLTDDSLTSLASNEAPLGRQADRRFVPWWVDEEDQEAFLDAGPYVRAIWMWREMARCCRVTFDALPSRAGTRVLTVRYERFVRNPLEVGMEIVDHLGGTMTRRMRRRLETAHDGSIGAYLERDPAEIAKAEEVAGPELRAHRYL